MAYSWVKSSVRGLQSSRAGFLDVRTAAVGPTKYRNLSTAARAPATTTSSLPTSPLVSTLVRDVDECKSGRGVATLGLVRCASGAVYRRNAREVQLRRMHSAFAPPFSARGAGLRQAYAAVGRHPSGLASWSRFSMSTEAPKNPHESTGGEEAASIPAAEADVAEVVEPQTAEEPRHAHIEMPSITDVGVKKKRCFLGSA